MNATFDTAPFFQLEMLGNRLADKNGLAEELSKTLLGLIRKGFDTGTSPAGTPWKPLLIRVGGDPLVDTGALRDSITATVVAGGEEIDLSTDKIQANVHQFGATITPKNGPFLIFGGRGGHPVFAKSVTIPARPYMPSGDFSDSWVSAIDATLGKFFDVSKR